MYKKIKSIVFAIAILGLCSHSIAQTKPSAGMLRFPDVSAENIVFSYADDLWIVSRDGGMALPLASPAGAERLPRFSADGKQIAFVGNYDGGSDIYTISKDGGIPKRMTFHPATENLCDWHPDDKSLIYSSNGFAGLGRQPQLMTISEAAPIPSQLPVPYGTNGAISPDQKWLAYTPHSRDTRTWKRYRGGMASDIWLFNLEDKTSKQITDFEGTDTMPMWHGTTVYYLSDGGPESRLNIWSFDTKSGERKQITKFAYDDCKWPSIGPGADGKGEIVFSNAKDLYLLNLGTEKAAAVSVTIPGSRPQLKRQKIDATDYISGGDISPTGKRIAIEARGDIWSAPAKNGSPRNLTQSNDAADRDPLWSPDGRWIAFLSDKTGEYELYLMQSDGRGETRQLTKDGNCYRFMSTWSPDSKHILFTDKTGKLFLHTIESGDTKLIDTDPTAGQMATNWSHDSHWICYAKNADDTGAASSIWVYNVGDGSKRKLTNDFFNDTSPTFDRKGDFIYFASNRAFNAPKYEDLGTTFIYSGTQVLIAMPLRADVKHPMAVKSDEETWKDDSKSDESKETDAKSDAQKSPSDEKADDDKTDDKDKSEESAEKKADPFRIEFDGIARRCFQLPVGQGAFGSLAVNDKNHLIYAQRPPRGSDGKREIKVIDMSADKKEAKTVVDGATNFAISADGKKLLVMARGSLYTIGAASGQKLDAKVVTDGMNVMVDPRAEWEQIFWDAWRIERDFFYDPNMHVVDWKAVGDHYASMLDDCVSRRDLSFLIREMIAEINVGHAYYREGTVENGPTGSNVGLLGCTFDVEGDRYKIGRLFEGAEWDTDARNPLRMVGIKSGQYLLQINGNDLKTDQNPYEAFEGTAGQTVSLTISDDAKLDDDDKRVILKPLSNDTNLRFRDWIERNRQRVSEQSNGDVGYIYVVNTGVPGQNDLVRQFYGQIGKKALIVDDRWNGGGQIPTRFIELLNRPVTNYWALRDGRDWTWPPDSHQGPKCMLTNGMAGSGGDMFPALFKQAGLGKLIGMRTWGGLVGISGGPTLVDGASVTAPSFAYYEKDGTWGIEGHGVDPDIKVIDDPAKMVDGGDPQLDAAIEQMKREIETNGYQPPKRPAYPDRSKFGLDPKDK